MVQQYGVNAILGDTLGAPPITVASEIPAVIGMFPCNKKVDATKGKPGQWYRNLSWTDYKDKYGFEELWGSGNLKRSDGWNAPKTIETLQKQFGLYPVLTYNLLDPAEHKADITDEDVVFAAGALTQPVANKYAMLDTFVIQDSGDTITYIEGTDYSLELVLGIVQITRIAAGDIGETDTVHVDYSYCDPTAVTNLQVVTAIGKVNSIVTDLSFANLAGWIHCPEFSRKDWNNIESASVRGALLTQAKFMNEVFTTRFVYDLDETAFVASNDTADLFTEKTVLSEHGRALNFAGTLSTGETEQLWSDWYIGLMALEVANNGYPGASPSSRVAENYIPNKPLSWPTQSNAIRAKGIITGSLDPGDRGWTIWGTETSYFNGTATDLAKDSTNQNDLWNYLHKQIIIDTWVKSTDRNFNSIMVKDLTEKWNALGKMKVSQGKLLGFKISFLPEDNPDLSQYVKFRIALLGPEPAKRTDFEFNVDLNYFNTLFG